MSDLMQAGTFDYKSLAEQYDDFRTPAVRVTVGNKKYTTAAAKLAKNGGILIQSLEAELHHREAGTVQLSFGNVYDQESGSFQEIASLGETCRVEIGYQSVFQEIFRGYVGEIRYIYGKEPEIHVQMFDAMTLMAQNCRSRYYVDQKCADCVKTILKSYNGIVSVAKADASGEEPIPFLSCHAQNDLTFIQETLCPYAAKEFYIFDGKAYFLPVSKRVQTPCVSLHLGRTLFDFRLMASYGNLETAVCGISAKNPEEEVRHKESGKTDFSQESVTSLPQTRFYSDMKLTDAASVQNHASYFLEDILASLQTGEGTCIGLPELVPGRCMEIRGIQKSYDKKKFWIDSVYHTINQYGFSTRFAVRGWT